MLSKRRDYIVEAKTISLDLKKLILYEVCAYAEYIRLTPDERIYFDYAGPRRDFFDPFRPETRIWYAQSKIPTLDTPAS